ncbi:hypothetical protein [Noviherbaspirillum soli]|uniref:hypothetical protein n=1 Tax=Noviherbaspirillum soli TaxID=1064518 RepID=UPI00188B8F62|nr:hypothetical protein [Noviherbaspirillum soli]
MLKIKGSSRQISDFWPAGKKLDFFKISANNVDYQLMQPSIIDRSEQVIRGGSVA